MSDLAATNCGCGCEDRCPRSNGIFGGDNSCIWIIVLLLACCGGGSGIGSGCGCEGSDNSCCWIIILLLLCGGGCGSF